MNGNHRHTTLPERTRKYWKAFLHDFKPCYFPSLLEDDEPRTFESTTLQDGNDFHDAISKLDNVGHSAIRDFCSKYQVTLGVLFQAAWAIVLACYAGVEDVSFGYSDEEEKKEEGISGDNVFICRTRITAERVLSQIMADLAADLDSAKAHHRDYPVGMAEMQKIAGLQGYALFDSVLQTKRCSSKLAEIMATQKDEGVDILAQTSIEDDGSVEVAIRAKTSKFSAARTTDIAQAFAKTLVECLVLADPPSSTVGDLDVFTRCDYDKVMRWNRSLPDTVDACFHDLFEQAARKTPDAPAIVCSWGEGVHDYTYYELNAVSTKLANHLAKDLGVEAPETPVLICFDKSSIAMVSMLGIFKAGGAFVAIDSSYPVSRIQAIAEATNASLVLVQPTHRDIFQDNFSIKIVVLDTTYLDSLPSSSELPPRRVTPSNTAYIHFTSGSTGLPKGIMIEHRNLCTAVSALASPMRITSAARVLQWASYVFDLSFGDIFVTLSQGACICVPSEHERINDLAGAIVRMGVNTACLVPSVARILFPEDVPCLQTLLLGGEALLQENLERWADKVAMSAMYGPSECTVWCTSQVDLRVDSMASNIGRGYGALLWVVRSTDHDRLVPNGCIGELLIEGPVVARGYLDAGQTRRSFVENPKWAAPSSLPEPRKFYKTGDLVRYNTDGTLRFIGRKDTQIKLRGRRIEIGEIEHQLASHPLVQQSMVILPEEGAHTKRLVAIVVLPNITTIGTDNVNKSPKEEGTITMANESCTSDLAKIKDFLSSKLPAYMVPQAWVVVQDIPLLISGKMNRVLVKKFVEELAKSSAGESRPEEEGEEKEDEGKLETEAESEAKKSEEKEEAEYDDAADDFEVIEKRLQDIWIQALNIDKDVDHSNKSTTGAAALRVDQSFSALGGDSFAAMNLVARCRVEGLVLTVRDLLSDGSSITIRQMARMVKMHRRSTLNKNASTLAATLKVRPLWWDA